MRVFTVGHGARPGEELVQVLREAEVRTVVDVRRFPGSRRHPQFDQEALAAAVEEAGIAYTHVLALGGRLSREPGEDAFSCIQVAAFRSYAARMRTAEWQAALEDALTRPAPCFLCAETLWWRCHRRLIAELLHARGNEIVHLLKPGHSEPHRPWEPISEVRDGKLYLCSQLVA